MGKTGTRPVTVRIEDFQRALNEAVAMSELPAYLIEILMGQYLAGVSSVAKKEYEKDRLEWEQACLGQGVTEAEEKTEAEAGEADG